MQKSRYITPLRLLVAVALVMAIGAASSGPASAGGATLYVTKTVDGTAPAGTEFVIEVDCTQAVPNGGAEPTRGPVEPTFPIVLTFGADGGISDPIFFNTPHTCTVTETDNGGADSNTGPVDVDLDEPIRFDAEITNVFDPEPTTTTEAPTTTTPPTSAAAAAVAQAPTFTG